MAYNQYAPRQDQNRGYGNQGGKSGSWNNGNNRNGYQQSVPPAQIEAKELPKDYAEAAEQCIKAMIRPDTKPITKTKLRKLFGQFSTLYNNVVRQSEDLTEAQVDLLTQARIRIYYECGRDTRDGVYSFITQTELLSYLKSVGNSREKFIRFYHYFEALVAFAKFYGVEKD